MKNWRKRRKHEYEKRIPIGDQLDAILKAFDMVLEADGELPEDLINIINVWKEIKKKFSGEKNVGK